MIHAFNSKYICDEKNVLLHYLVSDHTLSLFSFLFTMTAVICWSMKIKIVASRAGMMAAIGSHPGFLSIGFTIQPLLSLVG